MKEVDKSQLVIHSKLYMICSSWTLYQIMKKKTSSVKVVKVEYQDHCKRA